MNLTAYHDEHGNIVAAIVRSDSAPPAHIDLGLPGLQIAEVAVDDLSNDLDSDELHERLTNLIAKQRIEVERTATRLQAKD